MLSIMRRQFQRNRVFLLVVMLVLASFEVLLCAMVSSMNVESAFNQISALAPPLVGVLIAVISFLVNAIAMLWSKALFAKPVSLHAYYEPREILTQGQWPVSSVLLLTAVAAVALALAFARFSRRDLL